jgi:hypothetical protein
LLFAFTNTAWHGTRMRRFNARGGQRPLTGTLYVPQISSEANVLEVMRNKIRQLVSFYNSLGTSSVTAPCIQVKSATDLRHIPDNSIDYIFTDPPFGSNIFYSDCNLIWESWLGGITKPEKEIVVNKSRSAASGGKSIEDYEELMTQSLSEANRVLKRNAHATLVFHNTDPAVWRAIQNAAHASGFSIENASTLNRKQQSHKGYKGRSDSEEVAHFDVIMSLRKQDKAMQLPLIVPPKNTIHKTRIIAKATKGLPIQQRTAQRVHSEAIQLLARTGGDMGSIGFSDVKQYLNQKLPDKAPKRKKRFEKINDKPKLMKKSKRTN